MPEFSFTQALVANSQSNNPLQGASWQYETPNFPYIAKLITDATGVSVRVSIFAGSVNIKQKSPVKGGGVAGTIPAELSTTPQLWRGDALQRVLVLFDEVGGLTPTINGTIVVEPDPSYGQ